MKFSLLFPHLRPWVLGLSHSWPGAMIKPNFAVWEVFHILALVMLAGGAIVAGLRLAGAGLRDEPPSVVYRGIQAILIAGVVGVTVTGLLIGSANAERLYDSTAFVAKILALVAGIILTFGALRPVALADGIVSPAAAGATAVGIAVWAAAVGVFLTGGLITPGLFHVITAAALLVFAICRGRLRWILAGGVAVILLAMYAATHLIVPAGDLEHSDSANVALAWAMTGWITAIAGVEGLGAVLAPTYSVLGELERGDLVPLLPRNRPVEDRFYLYQKKSKAALRKHRLLTEYLRGISPAEFGA